MTFVAKDFVPPYLETASYRYTKLGVSDTYDDYFAVMTSVDVIHRTRGSKWPTTALTYEDDFIDLAWHQREFEHNSSFAYVVRERDSNRYLACVYIYPASGHFLLPDTPVDADAIVSWWPTQVAFEEGFYDGLSLELKAWIERDWPFSKPYYANKMLPARF